MADKQLTMADILQIKRDLETAFIPIPTVWLFRHQEDQFWNILRNIGIAHEMPEEAARYLIEARMFGVQIDYLCEGRAPKKGDLIFTGESFVEWNPKFFEVPVA